MGSQRPRPVVLDAGALIAFERLDRRIVRLLELAEEVHVPGAVVAQVWRNPARQVRLVRLLAAEPVTLVPLDGIEARAVGQLCAASGTSDVADASVALLGRRTGGVVVTTDPDDLRRINPGLDVVVC
ncbi:MAG: PIN domain-containing protein [Actinomycetota bacterium]|nr:PIN domain-containing protein [Actinomycetota bacterium]